MAQLNEPLLVVDGLCVHFPSALGLVRAVEDFSLDIGPGQRWGLLGESGCGKTVAALSILRLLPATAVIVGRIRLGGKDMLSLPPRRLRRVRGAEVAMIFEQPGTSLDPLFPVGAQVAETILAHEPVGKKAARQRACELLRRVHIPDPVRCLGLYPHELSGGMRQRVAIAMALALSPRLIVADEPTTALDPTVQGQIIDLLNEALDQTGAALLLITHDTDAARALCAHAAIMYAGQLVEKGDLPMVFEAPRHPYTQALLTALGGDRPRPIAGRTPALTDLPSGCRFHPRCPLATSHCRVAAPALADGVRCGQ